MIIGDIVSVEGDKFIVKLRTDIQVRPCIGDFVGIQAGEEKVVGVISSTVNRIKEELLPYMDSEKIPKYLPYVEDYSENLLVVQGLGKIGAQGKPEQGAISAVGLKSSVESLVDEDVLTFHKIENGFEAGYIFKLRDKLEPSVFMRMFSKLESVMPDDMGPNLRAAKRLMEGGGFQ